jgi:hypothetical protein
MRRPRHRSRQFGRSVARSRTSLLGDVDHSRRAAKRDGTKCRPDHRSRPWHAVRRGRCGVTGHSGAWPRTPACRDDSCGGAALAGISHSRRTGYGRDHSIRVATRRASCGLAASGEPSAAGPAVGDHGGVLLRDGWNRPLSDSRAPIEDVACRTGKLVGKTVVDGGEFVGICHGRRARGAWRNATVIVKCWLDMPGSVQDPYLRRLSLRSLLLRAIRGIECPIIGWSRGC